MSREFANLSPDEIKAEIKKREEKGEDLDSGARGESRDSVLSKLAGSLSDIGNIITGNNRGGGQDFYIDKDGKYKQRTCFTKGTPVSTSTGKKPVESIKNGDIVFAKDEKTGRIVTSKVQQTYVRTTDRIYKLEYEDGTAIESTATHPFFIAGDSDTTALATLNSPSAGQASTDSTGSPTGKWIEARFLKEGDRSVRLNSSTLAISHIVVEDRNETVYNFTVEDNHNYFVGDSEVLVHNEKYQELQPIRKDLGQSVTISGREMKKMDGAGERYECVANCGEGIKRERVVFQDDGTSVQQIEYADGTIKNAVYDKNGNFVGNAATDAKTAKNMAVLNFNEEKDAKGNLISRDTTVNGVKFELGARDDWGNNLSSFSAGNSEGRGINGQIFLSVADTAKDVGVKTIQVNSLNYGLNDNNECGSHCSARAMDIHSISTGDKTAYFQRGNSKFPENSDLRNDFTKSFWNNEVEAGRTKGIMAWTPDLMRGSDFGDKSWSKNPVIDSNYKNQSKLDDNQRKLLRIGKIHDTHGHFSSGVKPKGK